CQAEDGIRDFHVTGVQTCALPISAISRPPTPSRLLRPGGDPDPRPAPILRKPRAHPTQPRILSCRTNPPPMSHGVMAPTLHGERSEVRRVGKEGRARRRWRL